MTGERRGRRGSAAARALLIGAHRLEKTSALSRTGTARNRQAGGAPMKHSSIREVFDYWNERRGRRPAPERADIEPAAIRRVLADTFILAFEPGRGHPFRVAGTRLCALFGRELKNEPFLDLWSGASRDQVRDLLAIVADEAVGVVASAAGASPADAALELVLLPLSHRGRTDARLLGALAPREPPAWIGIHALAGLTLGTHRYVGGPLSGPGVPPVVPPRHDGRIRHGFVVYDGGQS